MIKLFPKSVTGWSLLTRIYVSKEQFRRALEPSRKVYEMNETHESSLMYAYVLELNGRTQEAVKIYDTIFSKTLSLDEILAQTLTLYRTFGDLKIILDRLEKMSAQLKKVSFGIEVQKAFLLWEMGKDQEAGLILEKLQTIYPTVPQVEYLTGLGYERMKQVDKALEWYGRLPEDSQFYLPSSYRRIQILQQVKRYDEAISIAKELAKSQWTSSDIYVMAANVFAEEKKYSEAIQFLEQGFNHFPRSSKLLFIKGVYEEKKGDELACIQTMRQAIKMDPSNSSALNYLGYLYAERSEKLALAEKLIVRALVLKPNDGFYLDSLGWVYYKNNDLEKATEMIEKALQLEPEEGVICEHLGDVWLAKGDHDKALSYFEQALKLHTEDEDKSRIEDKVKRLKAI
jgi:tetratricopeptide (TPR) repeat protein